MRQLLKLGLLIILAIRARIRIVLTRRPALVILTYHRVLPNDDVRRTYEQPGMMIAPHRLAAQMRLMKRLGATPIFLDDWVSRSQAGTALPKLCFAVTFDDGWQDNAEFAFPILIQEQVPATIFLVSGLLDTNRHFWPEQVAFCLTHGLRRVPDLLTSEEFNWITSANVEISGKSATIEEVNETINALKSISDVDILENIERCRSRFPDAFPSTSERQLLNHEEIMQMLASGLIRFGAHTRNHFRLNLLKNSSELQNEIVGSKEDLEARLNIPVTMFCYPNGDTDDEGQMMVENHYALACTTETGWNIAPCNPYSLRRYNVHDGNSGNGLAQLALLGR